MKLVRCLFALALLLGFGVAASADTPAATASDQVASQQALETQIFAAESGCEDAQPAVAPIDGENAEAKVIYCGSCSTGGCYGAPRGQICHLPFPQSGWGHCNIFSGGYMCGDGSGWECSCEGGDLD